MDTKTIEAVMKTVTIDTKIDGGKVEAVIGERARMEVERAVCYIKSGKAEIDAAVDARIGEIETAGQEYVDLAKDWAIKTDGTVDGVDYSSKYYAQSILPIASDITTVAGISSDVSTTAGIASDITSVAGNAADISAVAGDLTNINTVAGEISNVNAVAGDLTNIDAVNSNKTNIDTVAGVSSDVTTVAGISSNVTTVAGISSDVSAVAGNSTNINAVAGDLTNINAVAGDLTNIDNASSYAAQAKQWAIGDPTEPAGNSAKYWADEAASTLANKQDKLTVGNGIDITSNVISVTSPTLTNTATGNNSLAILGTIISASSAVAVGDGSQAGANGTSLGRSAYAGNGGLAVGAISKASGSWATAVGNGNILSNTATATGSKAIAIGHDAHATASNSIQIFEGTNSTADSLQVGSYELIDTSTGLIPDARIPSNIARTSAMAVSSLTDVTLSSLANGDVLKYNSTSQKWENGAGGGGVTMTYNIGTKTLTWS